MSFSFVTSAIRRETVTRIRYLDQISEDVRGPRVLQADRSFTLIPW